MWKKIGSWSGLVVVSLACLLLLSVVIGRVGVLGYRTYAVSSGSMSPTLDVGDVIYVTDGEPEVGDIVVLSVSGQLVTHRIVSWEDGRFVTKGDASEYPDTFKEAHITGIVRFHMPLLGHLALAGTEACLSDRSSIGIGIEASSWDTSTTVMTNEDDEGELPADVIAPLTLELSVQTTPAPSRSSTTTTTATRVEQNGIEQGPAEMMPDGIAPASEEPAEGIADSVEGDTGLGSSGSTTLSTQVERP